MSSDMMSAFQTCLAQSRNIIAVAGAGLSAASGIPTFRGAGGFWRKYDAMSLATPEAFEKSPALVWQFYHYRREAALKAQPNEAHLALAKFAIQSIRDKIAANSTFSLITQNVDGLSIRAEAAIDAPADQRSRTYEMHGRLFDLQCTSCDTTIFDQSSPVCAALAGTESLVDNSVMDPTIPEDQLPRCSKCSSLARPGVVWFGETPVHLSEIDDLVEAADLCLVVGTSSTVYPAAGYASQVKARGGKVAVFNLERSAGDRKADFLFLGPCEETLPKALGLTGTVSTTSSI